MKGRRLGSRLHRAARPLLCLSLAGAMLAASGACASLKDAASAEPGGSDTPPQADRPSGAVGAEQRPPDGGPAREEGKRPSPDTACSSWLPSANKPLGCTLRVVTNLVDDGSVEPNWLQGVSIAVTPSGRVGISAHDEEWADVGALDFITLTPSSPAIQRPKIDRRVGNFTAHYGLTHRLVAAEDRFLLLSHNTDDDLAGDLVLYESDANGVLPKDPRIVVSGIRGRTPLAFVPATGGRAYVTYPDRTASPSSTFLRSREILPTGQAPALDALDPNPGMEAPGSGVASLALDDTGRLHALYQRSVGASSSTPTYASLGPSTWSKRRAVDEDPALGLAGQGLALAVHGMKNFAVYFAGRSASPLPSTMELRLATWENPDDAPAVRVLRDQIDASKGMLYPQVAMKVDSFGLVHVALISATSGAKDGTLEYIREVPVGAGFSFLTDVVDPSVMNLGQGADPPSVDLALDKQDRPHIAYISSKDGRLRYATRFDRK